MVRATMTNVPPQLRYSVEHEWVRTEGDVVVIGITDHAQSALGDVVFLELPPVGRSLQLGKPFGVVESVKAVSDLYAPVNGVVVEVNQALVDAPEAINREPYTTAWMVKVKPNNTAELSSLLDAAGYQALLTTLAK
jgi:glycine cleavage system H protein